MTEALAHGAARPAVFWWKVTAIGCAAALLLAIPRDFRMRWFQVPLVLSPLVVGAAIGAAATVRVILRKPGRGWWLLGGLLMPLLASIYYAAVILVVEEIHVGTPLPTCFLAVAFAVYYGPIGCVLAWWGTFPLGLFGAWWLRRDLVPRQRDA